MLTQVGQKYIMEMEEVKQESKRDDPKVDIYLCISLGILDAKRIALTRTLPPSYNSMSCHNLT